MPGPKPSSVRLPIVAALILTAGTLASAQSRGTIIGTIKSPAPDVVLIATNQVTSTIARARVDAGGHYSLKVRPGAYRLSVAAPYLAKFDNTKNYGEHALVRDDALENVLVREDK